MKITKDEFKQYINRLSTIDKQSQKIIDKISNSSIEVQKAFFEKYFYEHRLMPEYNNFRMKYIYWSKQRKMELDFIKAIVELQNKNDITKEKIRQERITKKINELKPIFHELLYEDDMAYREKLLNNLLSIFHKEKSEEIREIILENIKNSYWIYYDEIIKKQFDEIFNF